MRARRGAARRCCSLVVIVGASHADDRLKQKPARFLWRVDVLVLKTSARCSIISILTAAQNGRRGDGIGIAACTQGRCGIKIAAPVTFPRCRGRWLAPSPTLCTCLSRPHRVFCTVLQSTLLTHETCCLCSPAFSPLFHYTFCLTRFALPAGGTLHSPLALTRVRAFSATATGSPVTPCIYMSGTSCMVSMPADLSLPSQCCVPAHIALPTPPHSLPLCSAWRREA